MSPLLSSILSARSPSRNRSNRREVRRLPPTTLAVCRLILPGTEVPLLAWIHDLSNKGVGLLIDRPCPTGVTLPVFLVNAAHSFGVAIDLRVVRCEPGAGGDFYVGGQFSRRLTAAEIECFMV